MKTAGIRQAQIKPCAVCGQGVAHDRQMTSYRVRLTYLVIDAVAVRRQSALEVMLGPMPALAAFLGPDEELLKPVSEEVELMVCVHCACRTTLASLHEIAAVRRGVVERC